MENIIQQLYQRQPSQEKHKILILIGCGGVGTWYALLSALFGAYETIVLCDPDRLEIHNFNRLPYPPTWVGRYKVDCLAKLIKWLRPWQSVIKYRDRVNPETLYCMVTPYRYSSLDIVDCSDNGATSAQLYNRVKSSIQESRYIKLGAEDGKVYSTCVPLFWGDQVGYAEGVQVSVIEAVASAVLGLVKRNLNEREDLYLELSQLFKKESN